MKILALETSTPIASFAAVELDADNLVVRAQTRVLSQARELSRHSVIACAEVLFAAGWTLDELDAVACGLGPGSWTGLRIGLTTAKTLAQARELPLLGVPTFDALALSAREVETGDVRLCLAVAPCRPGEVYAKSWEMRGHEMSPLQPERIAAPQIIADEILARGPASLIFTASGTAGERAGGEVAAAVQGSAAHLEIQRCDVTPEQLVINIARVAASRAVLGEHDDPLTLAPLYLAPSNAERNLAEKLAREGVK